VEFYNKQFKTYQEQIDILKQRGLNFKDEELAIFHLSTKNYYRLSGYWFNYLNQGKNDFYFEDFINIYNFDSELRSLLMAIIETLEVYLRSKLAYLLAKQDIYFLDNKRNFLDQTKYQKTYNEIYNNFKMQAKKELFAKHFLANYQKPYPIYVLVETMNFGNFVYLINNLADIELRDELAKEFNLDTGTFLVSWLKAFNGLRNMCAHHSRIYDKYFINLPRIDYKISQYWQKQSKKQPKQLDRLFFNIYLALKHFEKSYYRNITLTEQTNLLKRKFVNLDNFLINNIDYLNDLGFCEKYIQQVLKSKI
jgi:abortive infection bacteriophage resistance protein